MKRGHSIYIVLAALFLAVFRVEAQDSTLRLKISGEVLGTVNGELATVNAKNPFFTSGYIGAVFVIEVTDDTITINVVDPHTGDPVRTIFEFDNVTRIPTGDTTERFFALGQDMFVDGIPHPKLGSITFSDAVLTGTIQLDAGGAPAKVSATLEATGDSDEDIILFSAKIKGKTAFVPN